MKSSSKKTTSRKVLITVPEKLLDEIDQAAIEEHRSRSDLVREATRRYIADRTSRNRPIDDPRVRDALRRMDESRRTWREPFDSTAVIRQSRDSRYGPSSVPEDESED